MGLGNLLNLSAGPSAIVSFAAEGIFKAIKLGVGIHHAQVAANDSINRAVRALDAVRMPVVVNLDQLALQTFFGNELNLDTFPAFGQFSAELQEFNDTGGNPSPRTLRILAVAKTLVPALHNDPDLTDHPELKDLFAIGLDPTQPSIHAMVLSFVELFPAGPLPYQTHYDRLGDYWKAQLTISLGQIDQATVTAQTALNQAIRNLVMDAIFNSNSGAVTSGIAFAKNLKSISIQEEIDSLTARKAAATTDDDKQKLQDRITALTAFKGKLA